MAWENSLFIGCTHGDLVCDESIKVFKRFMEDWKPKHRVHLGDVFDFRAIRKGASPEERADGMKYDISCGMHLLDWFRPQILTLGNHDDRIWRCAEETSDATRAELFQGLCDDVETRLSKKRIRTIPWGVKNYAQLPMGGPKLIHGYRATMYPAKAHFENWGDCITAHVHKPDYYEARHIDGGKAFCLGTMADINKMKYADNWAAKLSWRNSFLYGIHNTKTGAWNAWPVVKETDGTWLSPHGVL